MSDSLNAAIWPNAYRKTRTEKSPSVGRPFLQGRYIPLEPTDLSSMYLHSLIQELLLYKGILRCRLCFHICNNFPIDFSGEASWETQLTKSSICVDVQWCEVISLSVSNTQTHTAFTSHFLPLLFPLEQMWGCLHTMIYFPMLNSEWLTLSFMHAPSAAHAQKLPEVFTPQWNHALHFQIA